MPYYKTCKHCGANIDVNEQCDCETEKIGGVVFGN